MHIERIQIEEGFLNGFDVWLKPGLNVVIGARGTGKTSLIELIRFCLDVDGYTPETTRRSRDHALSVLGSGQITLTLVDASGPFLRPIILSQTEIETVGLQPGGRLRLLDGFLGDQRSFAAAEAEATGLVRSLTVEADTIRKDLEKLNGQLAELPSIEEQLEQLAPQEQQVANLSADAQSRTGQLNVLTGTIAIKGVVAAAIHRFNSAVSRWRAALANVQSMGAAEAWPSNAGGDPLRALRTRIAAAHQHIAAALQELAAVETASAQMTTAFESEKIEFEDQARQLRREIESLQSGAGGIARRGQTLRERKAQLESLRGVVATRVTAMRSACAQRSRALDTLESIRTQRYEVRAHAAVSLNQILGPRIRIGVIQGGQTDAFATALAEALRGSGLRYNDLVVMLARRISPRELLEAVENDDYELVSTRGGMSIDRAARAVLALKEADLGTIATVLVDDYVTFALLDGSDHKDIADLSTGQRCTVILPLVLRHVDRLLIVDQPEDHIDNAFIADTLIKVILARPANGQLVFSTHNANIPVLGNADFVLQLGSDGRRGFPLVAAPLSTPQVVQAITSVMEGGADAFRRRATFYGGQPGQ
jgi:hypothetical protein